MTQRGFSLVELLIATAISGFLVVSLYQVIDQMRRNTTRLEDTAAFVDVVIRLEDELHRTFGGMMIPGISFSLAASSTGVDAKPTTTAATDSQKKEEKKAEDKKKVPPFFAELSEGRLVRCSCVTTNPLAVYGKAASVPVRVVYRVEPMADVPDRYRLMRQELRDYSLQDAEEQKTAVSYELLDMITTISLRVVVIDPEKSEKKPVFVEQRPWDSADEKHLELLPEAVIIDCSWTHDGREYSHTIYTTVATAGWYREHGANEKKSAEKESAQKSIPARSVPQSEAQRGAL